MLKSIHRRTVRRSLAITTALAGGCLIASAAGAQTLPVPGDAVTKGLTPGGQSPIITPVNTPSGPTLNVDLRAVGTVIDWDGFNVPGGSTIAFNDSRQIKLVPNIAVLNRDVSGLSSQISGSITSDPNVAVWIYNSHGILIGNGARIDTGSLVLTTLNPDQNDFLSGNNYSLTGADDLTAGITIEGNTRITVAGGNRGLILVAPKIESNGTMTATGQDVAFVTATDVTLNYNLGSPLSVVLNKGTSVPAASQIVRGTVSGKDVTFALASRDSVLDALLSVEATVTTASSSDRGIVLIAGNPANNVAGVSIGGTTAQTGGIAGIAVSGTLTSAGSDTNIIAAGNGAISLTRALRAGRDVLVDAGGLASVTNAVTAGRDYDVSGKGVTLGANNTTLLQQAVRNLTITANNGDLTGLGTLTLLGDSNGNGTGELTLATTGSSAGNIAFGSSTLLQGGPNGGLDVQIRVRSAANTVSLGDVNGNALRGAVGNVGFGNGLAITGALTVGDVDVNSALSLQSGALTAGTLESNGAITLGATGAMTVASIDANGAVGLSGTGATTIAGTVTARGSGSNIEILRTGAVSIGGDITAGRDLTIGSTGTPAASITAQGDIAARNISLVASGAQDLRGDVTARGTLGVTAGTTLTLPGQTRAAGSVTLRAAGMQLADVASTGGSLTAVAGAGGVTGFNGAGTRLSAEDALSVTANGGAINVLQAISNDGSVNLTGSGITAGTLGADGDITVDGAQSIVAVTGPVTAGGAYRVTGGTVTLGGSGAVTQSANGLVTITGGAGGITGLGALTLRSNNGGNGTEALTLAIVDTAPTGAIAFSAGSTLRGGAARQSDVQIRSGSADGSVTLGNVFARGLLGATGTVGFADGLVRNTAISVGDVNISRALLLNGAGVSGGDLVSGGAMTLISTGPLTASSLDASGNLLLSGTGDTTIAGLVQTRGAGRNVTIDRDGALQIGSLQSGGGIAIGATTAAASLDIGAVSSGGGLLANTVGVQTWRGAIQATGAIALSGQSIAARDVRSSGGAITLTGTGGAVTAGVIDGTGLTTLTSGGALTATSVRGGNGVRGTATGDVTIDGTTDGGSNGVSLSGASLDLNAVRASGGAVTLTSSTGPLQAGIIDGAGLTTLTSAGALTATSLRGGNGVRGTATGVVTIGGTTDGGSGGVSLSGSSLALQAVRASAGAITLTSAVGGLDADMIDTAGLTTLTSAGALNAASVRGGAGVRGTAAGAVTIGGTTDGGSGGVSLSGSSLALQAVRASNGAVTLTSTGGLLRAGVIDGGGLTTLSSAGTLDATSVRGGAGVKADAVGNVTINGLVDGGSGNVVVTATAGAARLAGGVTAGADYNVKAQSVTLGGTQSANGALTIGATAGGITGLSGLVLTANGNGVGNEAMTLTAVGGGIALTDNSVLNGGTARQSNVVIRTDGGLTLGAVNARSLAVNAGARVTGAITTGNLSLAQGLTLLGSAGGVRTGTITIGSGNLAIDATDGAVRTGDVSVGGTVALSGSSVDFADITGTAVTLQSIGAGASGITGDDITASGPVTLTAVSGSGGVTAGAIIATGTAGAVTIDSNDTVFLGSVNAGGTATITTRINPADILIAGGLEANGAVQLISARNVRSPFIRSANGALTILAPNGSLAGYAPNSLVELSTGPGSALTLDVGQSVQLGALTGGSISLRADSIEIDSINVGTNLVDLFADSGDLTINQGIRGGIVTLNSTGRTSVAGAIVASGALSLAGLSELSTRDLRGASVSLSSGGAIGAGAIVSDGIVLATGGRVTLGSITAGGLATLNATAGPLSTGAIVANGGLDARSTGALTITSLDTSGGSAAIVSGSTAQLGAANVSGNLAVQAAGAATLTGKVVAGGNYVVRGASVTLGGAGITQQAGGQISFTSDSGAISGGSGLSLLGNLAGGSSAMLIASAGQIALAGTTIDNGNGALGLRAGAGATVALGKIDAGTIGGITTAADGSMTVADTFQHDGAFTAGDITARDIGITLTAGPLTTGNIVTSGVTRLAAAGAVTTGDVRGAALDVSAGGALAGGNYLSGGTAKVAGGSVAIDRLVAGGAATIASTGALRIDTATGSTLAVTATGDLTGRAGNRAVLTSAAGDLSVDGKALVRLGNVGAAGQATIAGGDIDMAGTLTAARAALVKARNALTAGDVTAGGTLTLEAGGALSAQALRASGDLMVAATGNTAIDSVDTNGAMTLKGGNLTLGSGRASGAALIDATGLATLGQLTAGPTLTIRAADAALTGVQRAASVAFENRTGDTTALRLGDGTVADGFRLSDAEIKLVEADTLTFRQGNGALEIGTLAFDADAGRRSVDMLGTGAIAVRGVVSGAGAGRRFRLGGDATDAGMAKEINVVATNNAGGRLLFETADLELRGSRIAVGVAPGFIDALSGASMDQVISAFVGNANSSLYNANIGGGFYDAAAPTTVAAHSLTVRYGDYALFQNTGPAGQSTGVVLGAPNAPVSPALILQPTSPQSNAFALFGTINGVSGTSAALLGSGVVSLGGANLGTTRINGCLVGSGAGCLAAIVIQPTLQVFETTQQDVFGSVESLDVPFDPVVSGSNEELLTGLATMSPRAECDEGDSNCAAKAGETAK